MALAITHKEGDTEVLDLIRERKPPFSPEALVEEFASTILKYRCSRCLWATTTAATGPPSSS
jgi:hypothetical protein